MRVKNAATAAPTIFNLFFTPPLMLLLLLLSPSICRHHTYAPLAPATVLGFFMVTAAVAAAVAVAVAAAVAAASHPEPLTL